MIATKKELVARLSDLPDDTLLLYNTYPGRELKELVGCHDVDQGVLDGISDDEMARIFDMEYSPREDEDFWRSCEDVAMAIERRKEMHYTMVCVANEPENLLNALAQEAFDYWKEFENEDDEWMNDIRTVGELKSALERLINGWGIHCLLIGGRTYEYPDTDGIEKVKGFLANEPDDKPCRVVDVHI